MHTKYGVNGMEDRQLEETDCQETGHAVTAARFGRGTLLAGDVAQAIRPAVSGQGDQ